MALLAMGFTPQESFDLVLNFRLTRYKKYGWHTDKHEGHNGVEVGCGHFNAAITQGEYYGVEESSMRQLLSIVRSYTKENTDNCLYHELDREHDEQGILIVANQDISLQPWSKNDGSDNSENHTQFFVYDQIRDQALLAELWQFILDSNNTDQLEVNGQTQQLSDLQAIVDKQTNATLGLLGSSQGKPIYTVSVDENQGRLIITASGTAPTKDELNTF
jgi:hypothetical protein